MTVNVAGLVMDVEAAAERVAVRVRGGAEAGLDVFVVLRPYGKVVPGKKSAMNFGLLGL